MRSIRFIRSSDTPGGAAVSYTLADGTKSMVCTDYQLSPRGLTDVVARPRAKSPDVYWRGNVLYVARFVVRRAFTNLAAAHTFEHSHADQVSGRGVFQSSMGGRFSSLVSGANWTLTVQDIREEGIALIIFYEAMGPKPVTIGGGLSLPGPQWPYV